MRNTLSLRSEFFDTRGNKGSCTCLQKRLFTETREEKLSGSFCLNRNQPNCSAQLNLKDILKDRIFRSQMLEPSGKNVVVKPLKKKNQKGSFLGKKNLSLMSMHL